MALWCRDLKTVNVHSTHEPKHVTLIYPYYDNPQFLADQLHIWRQYPDVLQFNLTIIIVDDGSPESPAGPVVARGKAGLSIRVFRILEDRPWNWLAARNIGFHHAAEGWCLVTDMDHVVPVETMAKCVYGRHDPKVVYAFARREHTGDRIHPHSASFFMTRALFWTVGGYDERYSGVYGTDGLYRRRLAAVAPIRILSDDLVRFEYVGDSSTTRYQRKQPADATRKHAITATIAPGSPPKVLSFPYQEHHAC